MILVPTFSVIIPARNEELYLPFCLDAIERARRKVSVEGEVIVVSNRSTDRTEDIARDKGCVVVLDDSKNLSQIRNVGARNARGDIFITVDADSRMSENLLSDILAEVSRGKSIGGGVLILPERWSLGIVATAMLLLCMALRYGGISAGVFFCRREDFIAIGGFDETRVSAEDVDFARRLRRYGKTQGKKFSTILSSWIVTSCRKFDRFGDWYFFTNPAATLAALNGRDESVANRWWYDVDR